MKIPIPGQGTFLFKYNPQKNYIYTNPQPTIYLYDKSKKTQVCITLTNKNVSMKYNQEICPPDLSNNTGLSYIHGAYYWLSLDAQNQQIYVGLGEPRLETAIYKYKFSPNEKHTLETIIKIKTSNNIFIFKTIKDPITQNIPLKVKNTNELTMEEIAKQTYMPKPNLSITSQKLYDCIAGTHFQINTQDFPEFSQAIEYSIQTPGLWCYQTLLDKSTEFDPKKPNPLETYLRITLGQNNGESPGIPYVMEIWPPNHYSPVHSHANANAIIRVLHGDIHVKLFPFLTRKQDTVKEFACADFTEEDITWISPTLNQTHQLVNQNQTKTCITIQCYMYEDSNEKHYDFFDYLDAGNNRKQYEPDSDMDFIQFKQLMQTEWRTRKETVFEDPSKDPSKDPIL